VVGVVLGCPIWKGEGQGGGSTEQRLRRRRMATVVAFRQVPAGVWGGSRPMSFAESRGGSWLDWVGSAWLAGGPPR
jgi:hypothetical protein